jgi:hypothetical protein
VYLDFDIVDESEDKERSSITALLCDENHFFFIGSGDIRIPTESLDGEKTPPLPITS